MDHFVLMKPILNAAIVSIWKGGRKGYNKVEVVVMQMRQIQQNKRIGLVWLSKPKGRS